MCIYSCVHVRERSKAALCKQEAEEKVRVPTMWLGAEGTPSTHRVYRRDWEIYCFQALRNMPAPLAE